MRATRVHAAKRTAYFVVRVSTQPVVLAGGSEPHGVAWHGMAWRGAESRSGIARHSMAKHVTWHGMNSHNMARMHRNVYFIGSYVLSLLAIQGRKR
jgi:hypothetical protein